MTPLSSVAQWLFSLVGTDATQFLTRETATLFSQVIPVFLVIFALEAGRANAGFVLMGERGYSLVQKKKEDDHRWSGGKLLLSMWIFMRLATVLFSIIALVTCLYAAQAADLDALPEGIRLQLASYVLVGLVIPLMAILIMALYLVAGETEVQRRLKVRDAAPDGLQGTLPESNMPAKRLHTFRYPVAGIAIGLLLVGVGKQIARRL